MKKSKVSLSDILTVLHYSQDFDREDRQRALLLLTGQSISLQKQDTPKEADKQNEFITKIGSSSTNIQYVDDTIKDKVIEEIWTGISITYTKKETSSSKEYKDVEAFDLGEIPTFPDKLDFEPLFYPNKSREIFHYSIASERSDGKFDIDEIVHKVSKNQFIKVLPQKPQKHLPFKVQIMIDKTESMYPFKLDANWMVDELKKLIGKDQVDVYSFFQEPFSFDESPFGFKVSKEFKKTWFDFPKPSIPVVFLTDLCAGTPNHYYKIQNWYKFIQASKIYNNPVFFFVPFPKSTIPKQIRELNPNLIFWDRKTNIRNLWKKELVL